VENRLTNPRKIMQAALEYHGERNQVIKCIEEMAELTVELTKWLNSCGEEHQRHAAEAVFEIADVSIMLDQLGMVFDEAEITVARAGKLQRLVHAGRWIDPRGRNRRGDPGRLERAGRNRGATRSAL
jgi:hypothetical protein